jgi:S-adenosyl methyltransferase
MREPGQILAAAAGTLDLDQPVALLLMGVLGHVSAYADAQAVVDGLLEAFPPGSYLALADSVRTGDAHIEAGENYAETGACPTSCAVRPRSPVSSPASTWSSPEWHRCPSGARTRPRSRPCPWTRWAGSAANPPRRDRRDR